MDNVTLDAYKIVEIGTYISNELAKNGIHESTLVIPLEKEVLGKVNEDIFYRLYSDNTEAEYKPSEEIKVNLPNGLQMLFIEKDLATVDIR